MRDRLEGAPVLRVLEQDVAHVVDGDAAVVSGSGTDDDAIQAFQGKLGKLGFTWQFITLCGFHTIKLEFMPWTSFTVYLQNRCRLYLLAPANCENVHFA